MLHYDKNEMLHIQEGENHLGLMIHCFEYVTIALKCLVVTCNDFIQIIDNISVLVLPTFFLASIPLCPACMIILWQKLCYITFQLVHCSISSDLGAVHYVTQCSSCSWQNDGNSLSSLLAIGVR